MTRPAINCKLVSENNIRIGEHALIEFNLIPYTHTLQNICGHHRLEEPLVTRQIEDILVPPGLPIRNLYKIKLMNPIECHTNIQFFL